MGERLLTLREAAARLNVSIATLKRYIYEGKVRSAKLPGGHHRIPEAEIARVLSVGGFEAEAEGPGVFSGAGDGRLEVLERWMAELDAEVERLGAAIQALASFCGKVGKAEPSTEEPQKPMTGHHEVLVLGTGCKRCEQLYRLVGETLQRIGRTDVGLRHVKDLDEIAAYGPVLTPALVVDGEVVLSGRVPSAASLQEMLLERLG